MVVRVVSQNNTPKRITILGSTGSIGRNTLDLVAFDPNSYVVEVLTANTNVELLAEQSKKTGARLAVIADESLFILLKEALKDSDTEVAAGANALVEAASRPVDWVMSAIVGAAGLQPTLAAINTGAVIALANKECLVCAGEYMLSKIRKSGATILPVDSEHNAIFQVFETEQRSSIEKIILTASGGPFWGSSLNKMQNASPEEAIDHPNWNMGPKISIDSATMMNKGLELIEAHYLFSMDESRIDVLIHLESIVHSLVAYVDGSVLAQLGSPDMRIPIAYTLGWPNRITTPSTRLDLASIGSLSFEKPNPKLFPAIDLARHALSLGGSGPAVMNAANEVAVDAFLNKKITFLDIIKIVQFALDFCGASQISSLDDLISADKESRIIAGEQVVAWAGKGREF